MIRVLLVDDHALIRAAVKNLLNGQSDITVVAEATTGTEAVQLVRVHKPDIVLLDIGMPQMSGISVMSRIMQVKGLRVILLTSYADDLFTNKLMSTGASGYLTKAVGSEELLQAIRMVHNGEQYITPSIAEKMVATYLQGEAESPFQQLSNRELEIMLLICRGEKPVTIAKNLFISVKTVNGHRYQIFKKLNIDSDLEMTKLAIAHGLIDS